MRIAVFLDSYHIGGVQKVFITLANEWVRQGHNMFVYVLHSEGEFKGELDQRISIVDLNCSRLLKSFFIIPRLLSQHRIEYFMVGKDGENMFFTLMKMLTRFRCKLVLSQHNYLYFEGKADNSLYRRIQPIAMKLLYRHADHIVCVAKGIERYVKTLNVKRGQTTVIYNPMDIKAIEEASRKPIDESGRFITFCGRLSTVKNINLLINGFELFHRDHPDYRLLLLGDGREEASLRQLVASKGLDYCIRFVGSVANPHCYVARSQVFVLPSLTESFSMAICEAFVSGVTIVSTPSGGPNELLEDGRGYLLKAFDDADEMASTLALACEHPIDPQMLKDYVRQYETSQVAEQYIVMFSKLK